MSASSRFVIIKPPLPTSIKQRRYWNAPHGSALALALAETGRVHSGVVVAVARDTHAAHALEAELGVFAGADLDVLHFPDWETLPYDLFAPHPDIVSQRIATLYRLPAVNRGVLVVPVATLMQRLAPRSYIAGSGLVLTLGQKLDLAAPPRNLRLPSRAAGRRARRLRRARLADRHLSDGQRGAVPRRAVRRRDRIDPHVRS
jgi:transcription-repair coupling factor (superfamily II helicase)